MVWLGASLGAAAWGALASSLGLGRALMAAAVTQLAVTAVALVALRIEGPGDVPRLGETVTATFEK
jgi:hypothetical protein